MINKIVDAISMAISKEFGDEYEIYTESVEQGLKEPCFFVFCINQNSELFLNNKYKQINQFCIQYFASTSEKYIESNNVAERLYNTLEYILTGDNNAIRGTEMHAELSEEVLNIFVNYNTFTYKIKDENRMGSYSVNTNVKE